MLKKKSINVINLILSLSDALDLISPKLSKHQQRTAYVSWLKPSAKVVRYHHTPWEKFNEQLIHLGRGEIQE